MNKQCRLLTETPVITFRYAVRVVAIMLIGCVVPKGLEAQPTEPLTVYDNVSLNKVISAYRQGLIKYGFRLKGESTRNDGGGTEGTETSLVFEYPVTGYPHISRSELEFTISSPVGRSEPCSQCAVYGPEFIIDPKDAPDGEIQRLVAEMYLAQSRAMAAIELVLDKPSYKSKGPAYSPNKE